MNFDTLPVELIYRILHYVKPHHIFLSLRGVCVRLNQITANYDKFKVIDYTKICFTRQILIQ